MKYLDIFSKMVVIASDNEKDQKRVDSITTHVRSKMFPDVDIKKVSKEVGTAWKPNSHGAVCTNNVIFSADVEPKPDALLYDVVAMSIELACSFHAPVSIKIGEKSHTVSDRLDAVGVCANRFRSHVKHVSDLDKVRIKDLAEAAPPGKSVTPPPSEPYVCGC